MLRRVMGELKRRFQIPDEIPDKPDDLRAAFADWLSIATAQGRAIIILDGLNQLEDRDGAPDLVWLPSVIPANIRLMVSTLPGRPLDELRKREWPQMTVAPLQPEERKELIAGYLAQYRKSLSRPQVERIASGDQTSNPLYLRVLLEELRVFGIHEKLDERIGYYLAARTIPELYERVLIRWEEDYERDRPQLVRDTMTALWAARKGLAEFELLEILGSRGNPLPQACWSPLHLAAEQALVSRWGKIEFFHDYLRQAVRQRYLPSDRQQKAGHFRLADYFRGAELGPRKIEELPWQLCRAQAWKEIYELLVDDEFFQAIWKINHFDLMEYWALIESGSSLRMVKGYGVVLKNPEGHEEIVWSVASLLANTGHPAESLRLREYLVSYFKKKGDLDNLHGSLGNQASILYSRGDLDDAMKLHREEERICKEFGNVQGLAVSLTNQAILLAGDGNRPHEALPLAEEAYRLVTKHGFTYLEKRVKSILEDTRNRIK